MNIAGVFDSLGRDLRFAVRGLMRSPVFTFAAVVTLALGIGATTAIFSVVDAVLLRPLPYDDSGQIYRIRTIDSQGLPLGPVIEAHIDPLNEQRGAVLKAAYGFSNEASIVGGDGLPFAVSEYLASGEFFRIFTDALTLGRGFEPGDSVATVLSYRTWQGLFQSDPDIMGSTVMIDGTPRTVVGVAAPDFEFPAGTSAWTQFSAGASADALQMDGYARLIPGASGGELRAQLDVLAEGLAPWQDGGASRGNF